jgi:hypothetical protein
MSSRRDQLSAISQPETSAPQNVTEPGVAASAASDPARDDGLEARIARRACERYEARGREPGRDQDDWFEAERELLNADGPHPPADDPRMA